MGVASKCIVTCMSLMLEGPWVWPVRVEGVSGGEWVWPVSS